MNQNTNPRLILVLACTLLCGTAGEVSATTILRNICRIKGQEENVLQGPGLVVGLSGTGEAADAHTMRALARAFEVMGSPIPEAGFSGSDGLDELKKWKNTALVLVTARVPATGARRGDKLDCTVSALNGKSLEGGQLAFAALGGPNVADSTVYALASGPVHLDNPTQPLSGKVSGGCQMEEDVFTQYTRDGMITVVLDKNHANFSTATEIVDMVMQYYSLNKHQVQARDAANIEIMIPEQYRDEPVTFIADLLDKPVYSSTPESRVVINERTGSIVLDGEVEIGDVVVSHRNIVIDTGDQGRFAALDIEGQNKARLQDLVDALDSLHVSSDDSIEIIKQIYRSGKLHGKLIIE